MEEKRVREGKSLTYGCIASKKNWSHPGLEFSGSLLSSVFHSERVWAALRWGLLWMDLSFSDSQGRSVGTKGQITSPGALILLVPDSASLGSHSCPGQRGSPLVWTATARGRICCPGEGEGHPLLKASGTQEASWSWKLPLMWSGRSLPLSCHPRPFKPFPPSSANAWLEVSDLPGPGGQETWGPTLRLHSYFCMAQSLL